MVERSRGSTGQGSGGPGGCPVRAREFGYDSTAISVRKYPIFIIVALVKCVVQKYTIIIILPKIQLIQSFESFFNNVHVR